MPRKSATRQSAANLFAAARDLKHATNKTWNVAPRASMFTKKPKTSSSGKKMVRTKRLINSHAYRVAASGAASYVAQVLKNESVVYRTTMKTESKRCPWLPSLSKGAISILESFLCAYAAEATRNAASIRKGLGRNAKRLNGKMMRLGFEVADAAMFSSRPVPQTMHLIKSTKKKSGANKEKEEMEETEEMEQEEDYS